MRPFTWLTPFQQSLLALASNAQQYAWGTRYAYAFHGHQARLLLDMNFPSSRGHSALMQVHAVLERLLPFCVKVGTGRKRQFEFPDDDRSISWCPK